MKSMCRFLGLCCVAGGINALAQTAENHSFDNLNIVVPDGDITGVSDTQTISISSSVSSIADVDVSINIAGWGEDGAFNGDLYVSLTHESGFSVLLNRVGRRVGSMLGYSDDGLNITLDDDQPEERDIHKYRLEETGSESTRLASSLLTGIWQTDGRGVDPEMTLRTSNRDSMLESFDGLDANGEWTLLVSDLEEGGAAELVSWSLNFILVPEPREWAMVAGLGLLGFAWARRKIGNLPGSALRQP